MEFGSEIKVLEPESLAARVRLGFEKVVNSHA
jgi:predicted DNA-binding transcriptional regulator YafY